MERNGHLSESDEQLLELIQEGKVDAEIGVRLGLGTGEVRERTEALAAKLGVNGKAGLRARTLPRVSSAVSDAPMRRRSSRLKLGGGILTAAALLLAGVLIGRSTAPGSRAAVATPTRAVATHPTAVGANTAIVDGIASVDLGQFFVVPYHVNDGVTTVSQREALAVLSLRMPASSTEGPGRRPRRRPVR